MSRILSLLDIKKVTRKDRIHFLINIGIGIVIAIILHFLEYTMWGEDIINKAFDYFIFREAEVSAQQIINLKSENNGKISKQLLFVDIDTETYKKWGEPLITPRDELAKIIETAKSGGAKVIVLDILLEDEDCYHPEGDINFRKVLQTMTDQKMPAKIIFPVRALQDGNIKKNLYEDIIAENPNFYSAIAYISGPITDGVMRYWIPFEIIESGSKKVLWNMSFLSSVLANNKEEELKNIEDKIKEQKHRTTFFIKLNHRKEIVLSQEKYDIYNNRVRFLMIPPNTLPGFPDGNLFENSVRVDDIKYADFRDKIVIIGNSSPDTGDMHLTPVGNMPGIYFMGNTMNTILQGLQPSHVSRIINALIELAVIVFAAYLFLYLQSFAAFMVGSVITIVVFGVISYYSFIHSGVFPNFLFVVVGMSFHRIASNIEELIERILNKGGKI